MLSARAHQLARDRFGEGHLDTLAAASNLAGDLHALGEYQQARTLNEDTLTRCHQILGEDHPHTLAAASNLAADLRALGEYQQARTLNEDILTRRRRILGEDHPHTLGSADNLAGDLRALGEYQQATHWRSGSNANAGLDLIPSLPSLQARFRCAGAVNASRRSSRSGPDGATAA